MDAPYRPYGAAFELLHYHGPEVLAAGSAGTGKAQPLTSTVMTPHGPVPMGSLKVGDIVCSPSRESAPVIAVHPQGEKDVYRISFSTGEEVECCADHLWNVWWLGGIKRKNGRFTTPVNAVLSTAELLSRHLVGKDKRSKFWIPQGVAKFKESQVPIPPYVLGVLLGDGSLTRGTAEFTSADPFIPNEVSRELGTRYRVKHPYRYAYRISADGWRPRKRTTAKAGYMGFTYGKWRVHLRRPNGEMVYGGSYASKDDALNAVEENRPLSHSSREIDGDEGIWGHLRDLGLMGKGSRTKFVPERYKVNSESVRLAILQGLMDTDGTVDRKTGMPSFTSISKRLAEDVVFLVESLGGACRITTKQPPNGQLAYTCWIRFNDNKNLFRLPRKKELAKNRSKYPVKRKIKSIELVRRDQCQCISIDTNDGLYFTDRFVVTHNSVACLYKMHLCCDSLPNVRGLIVRRTRESLSEAALASFERFVLPKGHPARKGASRRLRQVYEYPNGSEIIVGGLDKSSKIMSTEFDLVYAQEAIELEEDHWESLTTRLRNYKLPFQQLMADTNPDRPTHWLKQRCDSGKTKILESRHEDNPLLWNAEKRQWTEEGVDYISKLDSLTGPRKQRLRYGRWVQAEGVVYEDWDARINVIEDFQVPIDWPRFWSVDFGWNHAFAFGWWAQDPDGRLYLYREIYQTKKLVDDHCKAIRYYSRNEPAPQFVITDHQAQERVIFEKAMKMRVTLAMKDVLPGIQACAERMRPQEDGKPRLMIMRNALVKVDKELKEAHKPTCLMEEVDGYVWNTNGGRKKGDEPLKVGDDAMDQMRYIVAQRDLVKRKKLWVR